jgi:small-conductance mechanosensitive channel
MAGLEFVDQLREALEHPWLRGAAIVAGFVVAAYAVEFLLGRVVRVVARRAITQLDDTVVRAVRRPIFLTVLFYGLSIASLSLNLPPRAQFIVDGLLSTLAVVIWTAAAFRIGTTCLEALSRRSRFGLVQPRTVPIFDMLLRVIVVGAAVYFTFLAWEIDVTAWLASAGIVGIAVGFAAKDSLANLFSGIFILADSPYKLGDWIVLDDHLRGKVTRIGVRSTRLLTPDDVEITVPNAVIGNSKIVNETGGPHVKQRIPIKISCAYGCDIERVRTVLLDCARDAANVCAEPKPTARVRAWGDSGLEMVLLVWIEDAGLRDQVVDDLNTRAYKAFMAANIEIPYPKRDLYLKELPPSAHLPGA